MAAQPISAPTQIPTEIKAVIDKVLGGFNSKDSAMYNGAFSSDAVVIDGMAPYRWTGPNAQDRWFADAEKWAHDLGVADENIAYDRVVRADVVGTHAYVVLSAKLSFTLKAELTVGVESSPSLWRSRATSGRSSRRPSRQHRCSGVISR